MNPVDDAEAESQVGEGHSSHPLNNGAAQMDGAQEIMAEAEEEDIVRRPTRRPEEPTEEERPRHE